ncbi:MogA/MoaB family molybdenum cofactor biosynthesis protein [Pseudodesulfovibrio cashew]|uniref:Molybdopterin adenylyltransferase n=1 Tax=Pseudodesulfovibrio cashew TaxID=2678688 RepID=A0A6I6JTF3_9BACT|nr:MogA/MoaB family molybdenum cofactor biosynthesis protein [Pseudodesulfovibrio cashew]QGY40934.1 MogA/MoaB family molybdenum cofactor biosynthesis protein [Pseudodesulfovibrio cashew]
MSEVSLSLTLNGPVKAGERVHLCSAEAGMGRLVTEAPLTGLRAGDRLTAGEGGFLVVSVGWLPGGAEHASTPLLLAEALAEAESGIMECRLERTGYALAWVTLSDKGAAGKRTDESGPLIGRMVGETLDLSLVQGFIIPDEPLRLKGLLADLSLVQRFDLVMTTGGTGVGPRDITPESTLAVIEKRLPGYERAMTAASLRKTPHGAISRAVAGTLGETLIVNMPGSPKAVAECLEPLLPTLRHTLEKLQGDPSDCAVLHR